MLPNYISKADLLHHFQPHRFRYASLAIRRVSSRWCWFVEINDKYENQIFKIYLPEKDQKAVNEMLEEFCEENRIHFVDIV